MIIFLMLAFAAAPPPALHVGRLLDDWVADLYARDPLVLEEACLVVGEIGKSAGTALPMLRRLLNHPSAPVRVRAAQALWRVGRDPTSCLVSLADGLRNGHSVSELLDVLAEIGPGAAPASGLLLEVALEGKHAAVAERVLMGLGEAALPALIRGVRAPTPATRRIAMGLIRRLDARLPDEGVAAVRLLLGDTDRTVRIDAATFLFTRGHGVAAVYAGLALALQGPDIEVREGTLRRITTIDVRPDPLLPALVPLLAGARNPTRLPAAQLVFEIEGRPMRVLPVYRRALADPVQDDWTEAVSGIGKLGPAAADLAPRVAELFRRELMATGRVTGWDPAEALARIGPASLPPLLDLFVSPPAVARITAVEVASAALADLGPETARAIGPLFGQADEELQARLIDLAGRLGPDAAPLVPKLLPHLKPGAGLRVATAEALTALGAAARPASPALIGLTASRDDTVAYAAALNALASIGLDRKRAAELTAVARRHPAARVRAAGLALLSRRAPTAPELDAYLRDALASRDTVEAGFAAVRERGRAAGAVVPRLIELLGGASASGAAEALAAVGPEARPALPSLRKLLTGESLPSHAAAMALVAIDPKAAAEAAGGLLTEHPDRAVGLLAASGRAEAYGPLRDVANNPARSVELREQAARGMARIDPARAQREPFLRDICMAGRSLDPAWLLLGKPGADTIRLRFESALASRQPARRAAAVAGLFQAGEAARPFLKRLRERMRDEDARVRFHAALATWRLTGDLDACRPIVSQELTAHRNGAMRGHFAGALGRIGRLARPFTDTLRDLEEDPDQEVRLAARRALAEVAGR